MSKTDDLSKAIDELVSCGESMIHAADVLRKILRLCEEQNKTTYSFEDVRKAFAEKSRMGYTEQVKALISRYGADKLSAVKETDYPELMTDLEALQ